MARLSSLSYSGNCVLAPEVLPQQGRFRRSTAVSVHPASTLQQPAWQQQQRRQQRRCAAILPAAYRDDVQPVPDLPAPTSSDLEADAQWIAGLISTWLDEEWTPLEVHRDLGIAAGAAYVTCRRNGDDDMSSLVVGMSSELLAFNYRETFVNAFEVANKVVEVLMMREGVPVCCVSQDDVERFERYNSGSGSNSGSDSVDGQ